MYHLVRYRYLTVINLLPVFMVMWQITSPGRRGWAKRCSDSSNVYLQADGWQLYHRTLIRSIKGNAYTQALLVISYDIMTSIPTRTVRELLGAAEQNVTHWQRRNTSCVDAVIN